MGKILVICPWMAQEERLGNNIVTITPTAPDELEAVVVYADECDLWDATELFLALRDYETIIVIRLTAESAVDQMLREIGVAATIIATSQPEQAIRRLVRMYLRTGRLIFDPC